MDQTAMHQSLKDKTILLVIAGGIAAYKSLMLIRRLRERGARIRPVLTRGGSQFVTPLSVAALAHEKVYSDIFSLTDEAEMGHLRLSQEADLILVAPATADILAKMSQGIADDLATTVLLAADAPIMVAPAMNHRMWHHPATQENIGRLLARGVRQCGPAHGQLAEDESGIGRMAEPDEIVDAIVGFFSDGQLLSGRKALVTSGPTYEPIDPVRFIGNRSSGKQGHAIAGALAALGAETILISGPTATPTPAGVSLIAVESARQMLDACQRALPVDIAVCAAAVADWRVDQQQGQKIKKGADGPPTLSLTENPDILATLSNGPNRPQLVIGFAAETDDLIANAQAKLQRKGCDWIVANDVSAERGTFGGDQNRVAIIDSNGIENWPEQSKTAVAQALARRIAETLKQTTDGTTDDKGETARASA